MPVFTDALIGDTTHLSAEEFGAYCLILFATWRNNGEPFADDDRKLSRICRVTMRRWQSKLRPVLAAFFCLADGTWRQKRLEKEWQIVAEKRAKFASNGAQGAEARWLKNNETTDSRSNSTHTHTQKEGMETETQGEAKNQESGFKKSEGVLGRCAPVETLAPTETEQAEVAALVEQTLAALRGGKGIRDPTAHQAAVKQAKFSNFVRQLHEWVGLSLDGGARWAAWEILAEAERCGERASMSRDARRELDRLDQMRRAAAMAMLPEAAD